MSDEPEKIPGRITVSREMIDSGFADDIRRAAARWLYGEPPTPEELAARKRYRAETQAIVEQRAVEHAARLRQASPTGGEVLILHGPSSERYPTCQGCDMAGYEADHPEWPCTTYRLVLEVEGFPAVTE